MAGCIFIAPSDGKCLVVVNIFSGLVELWLDRVAREFHEAFRLCCICGVGLQVFPQRNMLLIEKSLRNVICARLEPLTIHLCTLKNTIIYE